MPFWPWSGRSGLVSQDSRQWWPRLPGLSRAHRPSPHGTNKHCSPHSMMSVRLPLCHQVLVMVLGHQSLCTHMTHNSCNLHSLTPIPFPLLSLSATVHPYMSCTQAAPTFPTSSSLMLLNNVLVSPSLAKNLILVQKLTHDNNIYVEFDPLHKGPAVDGS